MSMRANWLRTSAAAARPAWATSRPSATSSGRSIAASSSSTPISPKRSPRPASRSPTAPGPEVAAHQVGGRRHRRGRARYRRRRGPRNFSEEAGSGTLVVEVRDSLTNTLLGRAIERRIAGDNGPWLRTAGVEPRRLRPAVPPLGPGQRPGPRRAEGARRSTSTASASRAEVASAAHARDVAVDGPREHVERDVAAFDHRVVERPQVVGRAELGLGVRAQADDLAVADLVAAGLAGPRAVAIDLALRLRSRLLPLRSMKKATPCSRVQRLWCRPVSTTSRQARNAWSCR